MEKIGIFYGSTEGHTEKVVTQIHQLLGGDDAAVLHNVNSSTADDMQEYTNLILACPTWEIGQLQEDWDSFIDELELEENQKGSVELNGTNPEVESHNEKVVYEHLQKLSERNADIVRTVYNYYVEGKNTPTEVLDDLEIRWGTSRSNIRMILKNFNDSIGQQISSEIKLRVTK